MKRIRGGSGIGDAIYVRVVGEHLIQQGDQVTVCSDKSDVFIGSGATVEPFSRERIDRLCHYTTGKQNPNTNQWQDVCRSAGIPEIPLRFDWAIRNQALVNNLRARAAGKPIVIIHGGRAPMARTDGFGAELMPDRVIFDSVLAALSDCFLVQAGKGEQIYPLRSDLDLCGKTSIPDLFDIATICSGMVAQCSFIVPLAECFDKPLLAIWSHRGLSTGRHPYISSITPSKILSKTTSSHIVDDWPDEQIQEEVGAFRRLL